MLASRIVLERDNTQDRKEDRYCYGFEGFCETALGSTARISPDLQETGKFPSKRARKYQNVGEKPAKTPKNTKKDDFDGCV